MHHLLGFTKTKLFVLIDIFLYLDDPLYFGDLFLKLVFGTVEGCFLKIRLFPMKKLNFNSKKSYIFCLLLIHIPI